MVAGPDKQKKEIIMSFNKSKKAQAAKETAKPPVARVRVGLVTASVWERVNDAGTFYAVTFERRYKDGEGNWQSTHSYDTHDLLALSKAADLAHTKILEAQASTQEGE